MVADLSFGVSCIFMIFLIFLIPFENFSGLKGRFFLFHLQSDFDDLGMLMEAVRMV